MLNEWDREEADADMAELTRLGRRASRLRRRGICVHGHAIVKFYGNGIPECGPEAAGLSDGQAKCLQCGKVFDSLDMLRDESKDLLG